MLDFKLLLLPTLLVMARTELAMPSAAVMTSASPLVLSLGSPVEITEPGVVRLFDGITLTTKQRQTIRELERKYRERHAELRRQRAKAPATRDAMRVSVRQLVASYAAEVRLLLTAEQRVAFERNLGVILR